MALFKTPSRLDVSHFNDARMHGAARVGTFRRFLSSLPESDKMIAGILGILLLIGCFASLCVLLRSFQIMVPAHGGTLHEGAVGNPRFINPLLATSDSDRDLVALTYAGLMGHDAKGALVPVIAESYTVSASGTVYTFTLRPNAQFSDGTTLTADDVVYTIQKAQDPALKSPSYSNWANVRVEAVDARTVRFTLPKAYAPFLEDTTLGILPKHVWQNLDDDQFAFSSSNTLPIGAGPFKAASTAHDSQGVVTGYMLDANSRYPLGKPYLSHIRFTYYTSVNDLQNAYDSGAIASAYGVTGTDVRTAPYARVFAVFFNSDENAAFENKDVRKALSLAVNRTKIVNDVLGGYAVAVNGPLPAGSSVPAVPLPDDAARIADAKAALSDAGYDFDADAGTWSRDGEKLSATIDTSNVPELKAVATEVQKDWQALGVPTDIAVHDPSELAQSVIRPRAYGALLFGEIIGTDPDLYAFWASSEAKDPGLNIANYMNDDVDTLLTKARTETDPSAASSTLVDAVSTIASDYPAAFLYTPQFLYAIPPYLHGVSLSEVTSPADRFWGVAGWYRYSEHVWPVFVHDRDASQ